MNTINQFLVTVFVSGGGLIVVNLKSEVILPSMTKKPFYQKY